jgi:hypothetical protein
MADDLRVALARAVVGRKVEADAVERIAKRLSELDHKVRGVNPCIYGICLDYFVERPEIDALLKESLSVGRVRKLEVFPWGIPRIDVFRVQVEQQFEGIPDIGPVHDH